MLGTAWHHLHPSSAITGRALRGPLWGTGCSVVKSFYLITFVTNGKRIAKVPDPKMQQGDCFAKRVTGELNSEKGIGRISARVVVRLHLRLGIHAGQADKMLVTCNGFTDHPVAALDAHTDFGSLENT